MKKNLRIYLAALALFVAGMGYLVYAGLSEGSTYHIDVADALALPAKNTKSVRVFGVVAPDSLVRGPNAMGATFVLRDLNNPAAAITVVYEGAVPEGLQPGIELYAEGKCDSAARMIAAKELTTTCPSKYKKENRS